MYQQVLTKFPDTVQRKVLVRKQAAKSSGVSFNLDLLIQYLEEEISTDEMLAVYMKNAKPDPTPTKPEKRRSDRTKTYSGTCMYCEGSHKPADCRRYSTPQERSNYLRENKLCLICASAQHSTSNCKKRMCFRCGGPHHTSCCFRGDPAEDKGRPKNTSLPMSRAAKHSTRDSERPPTHSKAAKMNAVSEDKFRQKVNPAPKLQSHERNDSSAKWEAACTKHNSVDVLTLLTSSAQPGEKETVGARALPKPAALPKPKSNTAKAKLPAVKRPAAVTGLAKSLRPTPEAKNTRHEYKNGNPHTRYGITLQTAPIRPLYPDAPSPIPEAKAPTLMASAVLAPSPKQSKKPRTTPVSLKPDEVLSTDEEREDITSVTIPPAPGNSQGDTPSTSPKSRTSPSKTNSPQQMHTFTCVQTQFFCHRIFARDSRRRNAEGYPLLDSYRANQP
ncbi:unnamed protein product [Cylicocyclus nassatus]|uniref:Uncharacterized protein n=1 Tax=Cylicocyclus nassatus TaxID=53992 RepID=A0AA36MEL2_CYLNA|nr:unnamed protein product [Cylicocyclus nassatus]